MTATRLKTQKDALAGAFGAAADAYHSAADVQREVAARLARRMARLGLESPRILEIGCGTGFLHQALAPDLPGAQWLLTDLSEAMVRRARITTDSGRTTFAVMDGECPALADKSCDLICASLVFQWFEDLSGTLARLSRLLKPGGVIAFTTLTGDSFPEWRKAHQDLGVTPAMRNYPSVEAFAAMAPADLSLVIEHERITRAYGDARLFLHHWKQIGTHLPDAARRPLPPGTMRKLLRRFETGISVTYDVAYGIGRKIRDAAP